MQSACWLCDGCFCVLSCSLTSDEVRKLYREGGAEANESTDIVFLSRQVSRLLRLPEPQLSRFEVAERRYAGFVLHTLKVRIHQETFCLKKKVKMANCYLKKVAFDFEIGRRCWSWTAAALCGQSCVLQLKEPCCFTRQ